MSKQSEAKERMGYQPKPVLHVCVNCNNFSSILKRKDTPWGQTYLEEKDIRCVIGEFVVKKMASCNEWTPKTANT